MLQRILLGMDSNIMPLQFLHRDLSPFLGSFTRTPLSQSSDICSSLQILFRSWCRIWIVHVVSSKHLMASSGILSTPPAFPFLRFFISLVASALVMPFVLMFNVGCLTSSGGSTGGGLFNICLKWSRHLASWSLVLVKIFPSASLIGAFADAGFPAKLSSYIVQCFDVSFAAGIFCFLS